MLSLESSKKKRHVKYFISLLQHGIQLVASPFKHRDACARRRVLYNKPIREHWYLYVVTSLQNPLPMNHDLVWPHRPNFEKLRLRPDYEVVSASDVIPFLQFPLI